MINRVYIDNYKCFQSFDCPLQALPLLLGGNGTGKTSVFDVLATLRDMLTKGTTSITAFPTSSKTAWDKRSIQVFELGISGNGGEYVYRLEIEHHLVSSKNRIKCEQLTYNGQRLFEFDGNDVHLFRDDFSPGPVFPFNWFRSAISTIPERPDNRKLTWFRRRLEKVYVFSPDPEHMSSYGTHEFETPDRPLHEFASWLRHLSQESMDVVYRLRDCLRDEVFEGLVDLRLEKVSEGTRVLKFEFNFPGQADSFSLMFEQLSTGQKNLVAIYTILLAKIEKDTTVCIDEPDNFIALREIQPWLVRLSDRVQDTDAQCLLISHHPEIIDYMAARQGLHFHREESGPVRVKPLAWEQADAIKPSELIARGWE